MGDSEINSLIDTAQDILAGRIDVLRGSSEMVSRIVHSNIELPPEYSVFAGVMMASAHLPIGPERQHWSAEALKAKDLEIAELTERHREKVLAACRSLIERLGQSENSHY